MSPIEPRTAKLHGRLVTYAEAGAGPVLLLVHGMAGGYENWREVIEPLARRCTVMAPDLPGHGASAAGSGDYWIGRLAVGLRDLLLAVGHESATLVGHSPGRPAALLSALRSIINVGGQRIDAGDRLYLAAQIPVLIVWGTRDPIIPVSHGERAHEAIAGSRLAVFDGVGHIPQVEAPARFVAVLERLLEQTEPARFDAAEWRARPLPTGCRQRTRRAGRPDSRRQSREPIP